MINVVRTEEDRSETLAFVDSSELVVHFPNRIDVPAYWEIQSMDKWCYAEAGDQAIASWSGEAYTLDPKFKWFRIGLSFFFTEGKSAVCFKLKFCNE